VKLDTCLADLHPQLAIEIEMSEGIKLRRSACGSELERHEQRCSVLSQPANDTVASPAAHQHLVT